MNFIQKSIAKLLGYPTIAQTQANLVVQNAFQWIADGMPIIDADQYDYVTNAYEAVGAVYECVSMISNKILECPRLVYEIKDEQKYKQYKNLIKSDNPADRSRAISMKDEVMVEVKIPNIEKLLNEPNPNENGDEYDEMRIACLLLTGNAFVYGNGSPERVKSQQWSELWALPEMTIISGGIMQPVKEYYMFYQMANEKQFPAAQIKHIKTVNPKWTTTGQQLYGISPLKAYLYAMDALKNADKQMDKQAKNGASFGVISPENKEDQWTKEQKDDFREKLGQSYASHEFLSRWMPSSIALKFQQIGLSVADLELLALSKAKAEDIYRAFHVPLYKRSMEQSALNNMKESGKQFIYDAVAPWCTKLDAADTEFICKPYKKATGKVYIIKRDISSLPELAADMKELTEWLEKSWWLTPNQKLEAQGYSRSEAQGMDEPIVPKTLVRLQDVVDGKTTGPDATTSPPSGA